MSNMIEHAKTLERTGLTRKQAEALVQVILSIVRVEVDALEARLALKFEAIDAKFDSMDAKLNAMEKQFYVLRINAIAGNAALVIGFVSIIIALLVK